MLFSPQRCFLLLFLSSFYAPLLPAPIVLQAYFIICDDAGRPLDLAYLSAQQRQALASVLYDYATRSGTRWEVRSVHDAEPPTQRSWSVRRVLTILAWLLLASGVLYASYHWYQYRQRLAQPEAPPEQVAPPEPLLVVAPAVVALDVPPLAMQLMDMQQPLLPQPIEVPAEQVDQPLLRGLELPPTPPPVPAPPEPQPAVDALAAQINDLLARLGAMEGELQAQQPPAVVRGVEQVLAGVKPFAQAVGAVLPLGGGVPTRQEEEARRLVAQLPAVPRGLPQPVPPVFDPGLDALGAQAQRIAVRQ